MSPVAKKIAIVAALEREIAPLVRGWSTHAVTAQNRQVKLFESEQAVVACGGIGPVCARIAADVVHQHLERQTLLFISAGFAGALEAKLRVGDLVIPSRIISDVDGLTIETQQPGDATLISAGAIAGTAIKGIFARKHSAQAVDMEAYSVADVASIYGVPFLALKVISDEFDFAMPPMGKFVNDLGQFSTAGFALYAAVRPWWWSTVMKLGRNASIASAKLCAALLQTIERQSHASLYNGERAQKGANLD